MIGNWFNSMGVSGKSPSRNHFSWLCIAILCIGFWLRVSGPHMSSFWLDEVHSVERASLPNWATYVENTIRTGHGPVYEWGVLRSWIRLGYNEFCVRFPIVLLGVLNNAIIFVIGRRLFGKRVALLIGLWTKPNASVKAEVRNALSKVTK